MQDKAIKSRIFLCMSCKDINFTCLMYRTQALFITCKKVLILLTFLDRLILLFLLVNRFIVWIILEISLLNGD